MRADADNSADFRIVETMYFKEEIRNLDIHAARMKNSAEYFGFSFDEDAFLNTARDSCRGLRDGRFRVRALLDREGNFTVAVTEIEREDDDLRIIISDVAVDSSNPFLYHKTTRRELYANELEKAKGMGYYDVIFQNERGEVTEGARANLYIKKGGRLYTPPVRCGLLNGTMRRFIMMQMDVEERVIIPRDLLEADEIYMSNAIIGLKQVYL